MPPTRGFTENYTEKREERPPENPVRMKRWSKEQQCRHVDTEQMGTVSNERHLGVCVVSHFTAHSVLTGCKS